tara:strand:- start:6 stop:593 length:588 start_codon:yes stop_codon:yes gene_type:complete
MSKCKKYSSFLTEQQTFDNWRDFLKEEKEPRRETRKMKERVLRLSPQEINYLKENNIPVPPHVINEVLPAIAGEVATTVGINLLTSMLGTEDGRNKMADMLVALPEWIAENLCNIPEKLLGGVEELDVAAGYAGAPPEAGVVTGLMKKLCGFSARLSYAPLYMIAYALRAIPSSADESFEDLEQLKPVPKLEATE